MTKPLLQVDGLRLTAAGGARLILDDVALRVDAGETVGLVGESGSGKSMTARAVLGLLPEGVSPAGGSVTLHGEELLGAAESRLRRLRGRGVGAILQDPFTMLNPLTTTGRHISESLPTAGRDRGQTSAEVARRLAEVGITAPGVADRYPFELSGGMRQRVALAAALAKDPALLIADEPTTALDATTQRQILALLRRLQHERGMGLLLITHDLRVAFSLCDRVYVAYAGSVVESAAPAMLREAPSHPYTVGLLRAEPAADRRQERLVGIPGSVPRAEEVTGRCPFTDRCPHARDVCRDGKPALVQVRDGQRSACRRFPDIAAVLVAEADGAAPSAPAAQAFPPDAAPEPALDPSLDPALDPTPDPRPDPAHDPTPVRATAPPPAGPVLEVKGLRKSYGRGRGRPPALDGVDLQVLLGRSTGVVGESGSGKTTLARCVLGLETPTSGSITLAGHDVSRYEALDRAQLAEVRRSVQCVFQDPYSSLNPAHTVGFALEEAARRGPASGDVAAEVERLLDLVHLPRAYAGRRPGALSGGERQRVAIARALAVHPRLLVCDEPVAALDVSVQAQVLEVLRSVTTLGVHLLFITHDLAVVRQMTDDLVVLEHGLVVESGPTEQVLEHPEHPYTRALLAAVPTGRPDWLAAGATRPVPAGRPAGPARDLEEDL